ncbi:NAD-dependent epimerase [Hydrogenophaga sp. ZJX-1]|uniref:NAD-dependent epimerase n=1 Tax=Hydrogenophaga sp. ZJX-1 TaxID=3404778 RepID=UPI003B28D90D
MKVLVTGAAGFIGFHSSKRLLELGIDVVGIDNLNDYYDVQLKHDRLEILQNIKGFTFHRMDLSDRPAIESLFSGNAFDVVLHLGAQAGVRYSIDNPFAYVESNITGMLTILEGCRHSKIKHLVYASSSSVYGANTKLPFSIEDRVDQPISLYAATKKADEMMAYAYAHLYKIPTTGLRFFTVYGPWGRPDMAYFKFANAIMEGRSIDVYNHGDMMRDFTYIDDIVDAIEKLIIGQGKPTNNSVSHSVYNLGHNKPENLLEMISILEKNLGRKTTKNLLPMQPGDVYATFADISKAQEDLQFQPQTTLENGIACFAKWHNEYYKSKYA